MFSFISAKLLTTCVILSATLSGLCSVDVKLDKLLLSHCDAYFQI